MQTKPGLAEREGGDSSQSCRQQTGAVQGDQGDQDWQSGQGDYQHRLLNLIFCRLEVVNLEAASYLLGGTFTKLEQDWKDSHSAYLRHKTSKLRC